MEIELITYIRVYFDDLFLFFYSEIVLAFFPMFILFINLRLSNEVWLDCFLGKSRFLNVFYF